MAEATLLHDTTAVYEPSLFGTYSKKIGMWLFLVSDSLTFGALLYAYSYGRISTPNWPTPFHSESIVNATIMTAFLLTSSLTMVLAVRASVQRDAKAQRLWLLAAMVCSIVLWLKPKVYDSSDVEVAGLYWHFVDLVWMFIFPLVYLMSAKIL